MAAEGIPEEDRRFAELVVSQGLCPREKVDECVSFIARLIEAGVTSVPRLGELLLRKGYLTPNQIHATLTLQAAGTPPTKRREGTGAREGTLPAEAAEAQKDPARRFGRYVLAERLGAGGMGEVWKAWDRELARWVALKFLKHEDPHQLARFRREAQTAASLSHPNIAAVYEVGEIEGRAFIAMQLIEGETLATFPRKDLRLGVELLRDAALAVHHAHEKGIIHRDLKPANLMVEGTPSSAGPSEGRRVYVMDFGLARPASVDSSLSVSGAILGTPAYMPPEQARGRSAEVTPRSDVYALGATLYETLAGRPPFQAAEVYALLKSVIDEEPEPLRGADRDLGTIAMKCLEKDPARRYASARELADDLTRWLEGRPILAHPPSAGYRLRKFLGRKKALVAAGAAGLAAVGIALGAVVPKWLAQKDETQKQLETLVKERRESREREKSLRELGVLWSEAVVIHEWRRQPLRKPEEIRRALEGLIARITAYVDRHRELPQGRYVRARARLYLGDLDGAEKDLKDALRGHPRFSPGWALLARVKLERYTITVYGTTGERWAAGGSAKPILAEAEEALRRGWSAGAEAIAIETWGLPRTGEDDVNEAVARALREFYGQGDRAAAAAILRKAHAESPSEEYCRWLGHLVTDDGEKRKWLEEAILRAPHYAPAWLDRATLQHQGRDATGAMDGLSKCIEIDPRMALALNNRGYLRWKAEDFKGAYEDFTRALEVDPRMTIAWSNLGVVQRDLKDLDGALKSHEKALALNPEFAAAWCSRGDARREKGDLDGALEDFKKAIELDPRMANAYVGRGGVHHRRGLKREAEAEYTRAVEADPGSALALYNRGAVREELGDPEGAISDYTLAIGADPRYAKAYVNRGALRAERDDPKGALADLSKAIEIDPRRAMAWNNRAGVRDRLGDPKGALDDYTKAVEADPKLAMAWANRAVLWGAQGRVDRAMDDLGRAIEADPRYAPAYNHRGGFRMEKDPEGALGDFTKAIDLEPRQAQAYANRGLLHARLRNFDAAIRDYETALRNAPARWPHRPQVQEWLESARRQGKK